MNVKEKQVLTHESVRELSLMVDNNDQLAKVIGYLKDNNLEINLNPCYDGQSGWHGTNIILEGRDLSGNGYCYTTGKLMRHIENHKTYLEIKDSDDFKAYKSLRKRFKSLDDYFGG